MRKSMSAKNVPTPTHRPGRPPGSKGIVQQIRDLTNDGKEITEYFYNTMKDPKASGVVRAKCAEWLGDRFFGKTPDIQLTGELTESQAAASLADTELETLARMLQSTNSPTTPVKASSQALEMTQETH